MKLLTLILVCCFSFAARGQARHQYIRLIAVQSGIEDKMKVVFAMPETPDSAKYYTGLKVTDIILAVELMEKKGYELVSITPAAASVGVIVTTAYMRRRR